MGEDKEREALKKEAGDLKQKIDELRRKTDMPVNSALGSPKIDAENADGRHDVKQDDEEED